MYSAETKNSQCCYESEFTMSVDTMPAQKRPYARPTLIFYGTMQEVTKNGHGSRPENKDSDSKNKRV